MGSFVTQALHSARVRVNEPNHKCYGRARLADRKEVAFVLLIGLQCVAVVAEAAVGEANDASARFKHKLEGREGL